MNKYIRIYNQIVDSAKNRTLTTYTESHHIQPKSLGGSDTPENLVDLTAREHFICHWMLTKIHTGQAKHKMINALRMLRAEKEYAMLQSSTLKGKGNGFYGKHHTAEAKARISSANKGRVQTPEEKDKQIQAITGRTRAPFSEEWKLNLSKAGSGQNNSLFGKKHSEEAKEKQRVKALGRKQSAETIAKKADAIRGSKREKLLCPHCSKLIAVNTYARWHGTNCKQK